MAATDSRRSLRCHRHFLIFLVFCCFLSVILAIPATRSLKSFKVYPSLQGTVSVPQFRKGKSNVETNVAEGRMDIELNDYPGPGANKGHEPVTPPKA